MTKNTFKMVDLFAGCGGLTDGFMQTGYYDDIAAVEWKGIDACLHDISER